MNIWFECLEKLKPRIEDESEFLWLQTLEFSQLAANRVKLIAPNGQVLTEVRKNCLSQINKELSSSLGEKVTIELATRDEPTRFNNLDGGEVYKSFLKSEYNFTNFIEGKSNCVAKAVACETAKNPGKNYNPLFIYGNVGLGKTHLLHSIGNEIKRNSPRMKVIYLTSMRFVNDMVRAHQTGEFATFNKYYRSLDVILVDDIQFFAGKERSQEEFFHTFNTLFQSGHQIVMTCDRYPRDIDGIQQRLKSRFVSGLAQPIYMPDLETRTAIILDKAKVMGLNFEKNAAIFLSKKIPSNVREIEGALNSVRANLAFQNICTPVSIEFIEKSLPDIIANHNKQASLDEIMVQVCRHFDVSFQDMTAKTRKKRITIARHFAMAIAKEITSKSLPEIAYNFGKRNHTTVLHACRKISELRRVDEQVDEDYKDLIRKITGSE